MITQKYQLCHTQNIFSIYAGHFFGNLFFLYFKSITFWEYKKIKIPENRSSPLFCYTQHYIIVLKIWIFFLQKIVLWLKPPLHHCLGNTYIAVPHSSLLLFWHTLGDYPPLFVPNLPFVPNSDEPSTHATTTWAQRQRTITAPKNLVALWLVQRAEIEIKCVE